MKVRLDIALDFDGIHTFEWQQSEAAGAVEVPRPTLERWTQEREAFTVAYLRWKHVAEEIEETLYRAEQRRQAPAEVSAGGEGAPVFAPAMRRDP